jgi:xylulokinase
MQFLGIDIGSSSIKASVLDGVSGLCLDTAVFPDSELPIRAPKPGWAEQDPEEWWRAVVNAIGKLVAGGKIIPTRLRGIGIAYQMHGLVAVDRKLKPVRDSIIWCDSRAVGIGNELFERAGKEKCLSALLNSPGNFTLSKLCWVKANEPDIYRKIYKIMLPGDYIAMKLTGETSTTISGLSEGILWHFKENRLATLLLETSGIDPEIISHTVPTFGIQGRLSKKTSELLCLPEGIPVTYRAGDQPNNAFALNVLKPGETAATAGTSGVVYGVTDRLQSDPASRVNTFAHVNHSPSEPRLGVLLCINGTGIANSWIRKITGSPNYEAMNRMAAAVPAGSRGLVFLPFGNGAERMLQNKENGSFVAGINFNIHERGHLFRAVHEGVAFAFFQGIGIMKDSGVDTRVIRAGSANMFLSNVFGITLATLSGSTIELFNTDGSLGAARGAALGAGFYKNSDECFSRLERVRVIEPDKMIRDHLLAAYETWKETLHRNS